MRIAVFGASGRTGRLVVEQALARGGRVRALVRRPEEFCLQHEALEVMAGDVTDSQAVGRVIRGQHAVLCVLGPRRGAPGEDCSTGTRHIVTAMECHGVRRLVCVTGAMIGHPKELLIGWIYPIMRTLLPSSQRRLLEDRRLQERIVMESGLDWTLVRPPRLSNERPSGNYRVAEDLPLDSFSHIGRADLAGFLLDQLDDERFLRRGVAIAY